MCFIGCIIGADNSPGLLLDVSRVCVLYFECSVLIGTLHCCFIVFAVVLSLPWFISFDFRYRQVVLTMFMLPTRTCPFYCFLLLIFYVSSHTTICYLSANLIYTLLLDTLSAGVTTYMKKNQVIISIVVFLKIHTELS